MMSDVLPLNARSLSYKWYGYNCSLEFDEEYLTYSCRKTPTNKVTKTPLWRIMPELLVDRSFPESSWRRARAARYSFAGAIIAYFSHINIYVPLLAPVLVVHSIVNMFFAMRVAFPLSKTKIVTEWGDEIAVIPHHDRIAGLRKRFEEMLIESVRAARRKHDGES